MDKFRKILVGNFLLLAVYYISAHFTFSLELPPLWGSPLWVPTGISLGAILIWGYWLLPAVFLGDFIIGAELYGLSTSTSILLAVLYGLQAVTHPWLASWVLRKYKLWPAPLINEINIIKFFIVSAGLTLFVTTLVFGFIGWQLEVLPSGPILSSLFLWWLGGAIGVVLFTPLVLILFSPSEAVWPSRRKSVAIPLTLIFIIVLALLYLLRDHDIQVRQEIFNGNVEFIHNEINKELAKNSQILYSMKAYFKNSQEVTLDDFNGYLSDLSAYQNTIGAIVWLDYVPHDKRKLYEKKQAGAIIGVNENGTFITAKQKDDYFPIKYSKFLNVTNDQEIKRLDICYQPQNKMICQALKTKQQIVLMPSILNYFENKQRFLLMLPVRQDKTLIGVAAQMFEYQTIINSSLDTDKRKWLDINVTDITNNESHVLFDSRPTNHVKDNNPPMFVIRYIDIGGRKWKLDYFPTSIFYTDHTSWIIYWMTSALLLCSLISVILLAMTGRMRQVRNEVEVKTCQLKESEHKYRSLIESIDTEYLIYSHGMDGIFDYVSPSVTNILGFSQEEFLKHYTDKMPNSALNHDVERYKQQTLSGSSSSYELEIFDNEEHIHTLIINERPRFDLNGEIVGVEGIAHDITERKEIQQNLEKLSLAVKHSPSAIIITNKKGIIEYANPKFSTITGYHDSDIVGQYPTILSPDLTDASIYKELWKTLLSGHEWKGELQSRKKNGDFYWAQVLIAPVFGTDGKISNFVATQNDVTEVRRLNEQTSYQASHDLLTGLINRHEFESRLKRSIDSAKRDLSEHSLAYLDLDQFKIVNDTCGHVAGDELLRQIGILMQNNIRSRDTLARLGGDEFAVIMEHCGIEQAHQACQQTIDLLQDFRFHWEEHTFTVGVSIGLAIIDRHTRDSNEVLKHADSACYVAKDTGRNRIAVHTEASQRLRQREGEIQWNSEITDALDNDRFLLYVQPIIPVGTVDTGISYEVLLRMKMPDGRIVPPGAFLPAAERYNSSIKIDRWVISHTLRWISKHADQLNHINVFNINLSGQTIGDEAMLGFILKEIENGDVPGEKIKFEITETAAIANLRDATLFMKTLSERGCRFALDDFGSGLSSFAYLKNLKVDSIKVDGMFVKDMATDQLDFEMVKAINDIGHVMGLETVAEFVESEEIMDKLREIGVDSAQGFSLGKPMPIDDISPTQSV